MGRKAVSIKNYPGFKEISGPDLIKKFDEHLKENDIKIRIDEVSKVEKESDYFLVSTVKKEKFSARTVIISSGAAPRPLEVPGEKKFIGKGVSYCSMCDGPVFSDKTVSVIGGGNAGFESAIFLSNYVKKIYILEYMPKVAAYESIQEIVKKNGETEIITNVAVKKIRGDNFVRSIVYEDRKTGKKEVLDVDGVFIEIGTQPVTSFARGLVDFNKRDEIKVEFETYQTKTPGLFAVGDANIGSFKQIITACGEGAKSALAAYQYLVRIRN